MKANELRLGSWINFLDSGDVCLHSKVELWNVFRDLELDYPKSRPIPLTEEWLLKFGFEKKKHYKDYFFKYNVCMSDFYIRPSYRGGYYWGFICSESIMDKETEHELYDVHNLKYVHQLQNLYFALTGNELTIKL